MQRFARKWDFHAIFLKKRKFIKNSPFLANGCVKKQNARKQTPLEMEFYCQYYITLPIGTFFKAWQWHCLNCGLTFTHFYLVTSDLLPNFLIAVTHSVFNNIKSNCWKWTLEKSGLQVLRKDFSGFQRCLQFNRISWWPCI